MLCQDDDVVSTREGLALVEHVNPAVAYPQESLFDLASVAS